MRVLIIADMEGVIGIDSHEACKRQAPQYRTGQQLLADEVNLIAETAREAGASRVSVIDWHAGGGNLSNELLSDDVSLVAEDFSPGYDVVLLTGYHAMAGAKNAFVSHTMNQSLTLMMNGELCGELALLSRWAGESDVPIALVVGDRATIDEAARFLPGTPGLAVKTAISWDRAECTPVDQAYHQLRAAVTGTLSTPDGWRIYRNAEPVRVQLKLDPEPAMVAKIPWLERDAEGWLSGEVHSTKDVIDLIDLCAALR